MRYIKKQDNEPECLTKFKQTLLDWKRRDDPIWEISQLNWDEFQNPDKALLHDVLLKEQGYICCYCGRRISKDNSLIEHLKPKSKSSNISYADLILTYHNLLASCKGYSEEQESEYKEKLKQDRDTSPLSEEHCGPKKGDWYHDDKMVSPLMQNCTEYFRYTGVGEIRATTDELMQNTAQETITRLGLNNPNLEKSRKNTIQRILKLVRDQKFSSQNIQKLIQGYDKQDAQGEYIRFCAAVLHVLKSQYIVAKKEGR